MPPRLVTQVLWNKLREKSVDKPEKQKMLDGVIQALQGKVCGVHETCKTQLLQAADGSLVLFSCSIGHAWPYIIHLQLLHSILHLVAHTATPFPPVCSSITTT